MEEGTGCGSAVGGLMSLASMGVGNRSGSVWGRLLSLKSIREGKWWVLGEGECMWVPWGEHRGLDWCGT